MSLPAMHAPRSLVTRPHAAWWAVVRTGQERQPWATASSPCTSDVSGQTMAGPGEKKPSLFQQIRVNAEKTAAKKQDEATKTARLDEQRRKQLVETASEEVRLQPDSATLNRGLLAAMAVDEA